MQIKGSDDGGTGSANTSGKTGNLEGQNDQHDDHHRRHDERRIARHRYPVCAQAHGRRLGPVDLGTFDVDQGLVAFGTTVSGKHGNRDVSTYQKSIPSAKLTLWGSTACLSSPS